jgi:protein SCO1
MDGFVLSCANKPRRDSSATLGMTSAARFCRLFGSFVSMRVFAFTLQAMAVLLLWSACDSSTLKEKKGESGETAVRFQVHGVLHKISPDHRRAVIAHEDIANYMKAMTMEFEIGDPREATALERGDVLAFRLSVTETKSWIDEIRKTGHAELPAYPNEAEKPPPTIDASLPDVALIDQSGRSFHLSELRGRALAITFFFTRCPLPNFCPLMNRNFEEVERDLTSKGMADRWQLLSVTIDPANDTPEVLASYAANYEMKPQQWVFATGAPDDIRKLGATFGLEFSETNGQINHNLRTVVIDPDGKVRRVFDGNDWQPAELAAEMGRAISNAR